MVRARNGMWLQENTVPDATAQTGLDRLKKNKNNKALSQAYGIDLEGAEKQMNMIKINSNEFIFVFSSYIILHDYSLKACLVF